MGEDGRLDHVSRAISRFTRKKTFYGLRTNLLALSITFRDPLKASFFLVNREMAMFLPPSITFHDSQLYHLLLHGSSSIQNNNVKRVNA